VTNNGNCAGRGLASIMVKRLCGLSVKDHLEDGSSGPGQSLSLQLVLHLDMMIGNYGFVAGVMATIAKPSADDEWGGKPITSHRSNRPFRESKASRIINFLRQ
jgi:hypothetical protein